MTVLDNKPNIIVGDPRVCPDPTKRAFETRIAAMAFAAEHDEHNHSDNTPYQCSGCKAWHNTTNTPSRRKPKSASARVNEAAKDWPAAPLRPGTELDVRFCILHPKTAAFWFQNLNIHNRGLRDKGASAYGIDIHTGGWDFNGDTFRFDTDGAFFDGQHRAKAIAEEGDPVPIILVTGLDPQAQDTTDTGMRRTFADALKLAGEIDVNNLASVTMGVFRWKTGQIRGMKTGVSVRVLQKVLRDNPKIRDAVKAARRLHTHVAVQNSISGLCSFLFAAISQDDHDFFFEKLASGADLAEGSPIRLLRERLLADIRSKSSLPKVEIIALFIKAWNHYRDGNEITHLRFINGGARPEAFPTPH